RPAGWWEGALQRQHVRPEAACDLLCQRVVLGPLQAAIEGSFVLLDPRMVEVVEDARIDACPIVNRHGAFLRGCRGVTWSLYRRGEHGWAGRAWREAVHGRQDGVHQPERETRTHTERTEDHRGSTANWSPVVLFLSPVKIRTCVMFRPQGTIRRHLSPCG